MVEFFHFYLNTKIYFSFNQEGSSFSFRGIGDSCMNLYQGMQDYTSTWTLDQTNKYPIALYLAKQNYVSLQPRRKFGALSPFRKLGSVRAEFGRRYAFFEGSLTLTFLPSSFLTDWLTAAGGGGGSEARAACPIRCHRRSVLPIAHGVLLLAARRPTPCRRARRSPCRAPCASRCRARRKGKKALRLTGYD